MGSSVIFSGSKVKTLKSIIDLFGGSQIHTGTTDPTASAVDAKTGSIYLNYSTGTFYRKLDDGSTTNWVEGAGGGTTTDNGVTTTDASAASKTVNSGTTLFHPYVTIQAAHTYTINGQFVSAGDVTVSGTLTINGTSIILN